jgi:hypothetical protein
MELNEGAQRVGPLTPALGLLREMRIDPADVLASAGLPSDGLNDPDATISYLAAGRFLQACVGHTGCRRFAAGCNFLRELAGLAPDEIRMARTAPVDLRPYRALLPCPASFDAEQTALVLRSSLLERPILTADPVAHSELQRRIPEYWAASKPDITTQLLRVLRPRIVL